MDMMYDKKLIKFSDCLRKDISINYMNINRGKWKCSHCKTTGSPLDLLMDYKNMFVMFCCPHCQSNEWEWVN